MNQEVNPSPVPLGVGAHLKGSIATVRKLLDDLIDGEMQALGLSIGEGDVLTVVLIARGGPPAPKLLAEWLSVTTAGMAGRLNSLEAKGLIERRPDPSDGRRLTVHLTSAGRALATKVLAVRDESLGNLLLRELGDAKARELAASLDNLTEILRRELD